MTNISSDTWHNLNIFRLGKEKGFSSRWAIDLTHVGRRQTIKKSLPLFQFSRHRLRWNLVVKPSFKKNHVVSVSEDYTSGINLPYFTPKLTPQYSNYIAAELTKAVTWHSAPTAVLTHRHIQQLSTVHTTTFQVTKLLAYHVPPAHVASVNRLVNWSQADATWSHCFGIKLYILRNVETHRAAQLRTSSSCQKR